MDSALAWIGQVAEWFGRFVPRQVILDTTQGAIKYKNGSEPIYCGPGIHWYWPWRSTWVEYPMAQQTDRLETQTMESSDGKTFLVSGTLTYEVIDLLKLAPRTYFSMHVTTGLAMVTIHDILGSMTWDDLQREQQRDTLKTKLRNATQKKLDEYGIRVLRLQLNSLARCRVIRLSQATSTEDN